MMSDKPQLVAVSVRSPWPSGAKPLKLNGHWNIGTF